MSDNENDLEQRIQRKAAHLLWQRSQSALRSGRPLEDGADLTDLTGLWLRCVADATYQETALPAAPAAPAAPADGGIKAPPLRLAVVETKDAAGRYARKLAGDDADGTVEGYLATWDKDLVNDIIEPGAFTKTITESKAVAQRHNTPALLPLLWQHDKLEPIGGIVDAREDSHGLYITARVNRNIERGRQAYDGLKGGYMAFSIGYRPVKYDWKANVRHLREIALAEGSAVTFPANPEARATRAA